MTLIDSLPALVYTSLGLVIYGLGGVIKRWWQTSTEDRRKKVDAQARAERQARLLTESLHEHRNLMLKSGQWSRDTLPPFIKE